MPPEITVTSTAPLPTAATLPAPAAAETRFVNAMRLNGRCWVAVAALVVLVALATPPLWKQIERFDTGPDYRIPYGLSRDYWLYERRLQQVQPTNIVMIGDSVIWGEYVRRDGTLPHFLSEQAGEPGKFVNAGVDGVFPLALEGLIRYYGKPLGHRKIILHCNVLWMSSPKTDLSTQKEERFNHEELVPQFSPKIPCYKADLNHRLALVIERHFSFAEWANHLQVAYFGQKNLLSWTLEDDGSSPPRLPNAYKNPFTQITLQVPSESAADPERGPSSARHKPWSMSGEGSSRFEWVSLDRSLQWAAFQRLAELLKSRDNDVLVVLGPFNEHIMAEENHAAFRKLRGGIIDWLSQNRIPHIAPETLPSPLYADASHPLTEGYQALAKQIYSDPVFRKWLNEIMP
jgi:hypothetical protein